MLAPRNKLWSTPTEVMDVALDLIELSSEDTLYDIGAGDGRFIMHCHKRTGSRCIGIEINEERAESARREITQSGYLDSDCCIITGNALEQVQVCETWRTLLTTVDSDSNFTKSATSHYRITHQLQPYFFISFRED